MKAQEYRDHIERYLKQDLCRGNLNNCQLPECPICGEMACVEHLRRWYYCSPDPRDED